MAVQQDGLRGGLQGRFERLQFAGRRFTRQKFFEQQGMLADGLRCLTQTHHQHLIAQGQQAGWLQPDDGDAFFCKRQQGVY